MSTPTTPYHIARPHVCVAVLFRDCQGGRLGESIAAQINSLKILEFWSGRCFVLVDPTTDTTHASHHMHASSSYPHPNPQDKKMDAVKRVASLAFFALFTLGTIVQLNDPDPEV